jgi:hypothetical protein
MTVIEFLPIIVPSFFLGFSVCLCVVEAQEIRDEQRNENRSGDARLLLRKLDSLSKENEKLGNELSDALSLASFHSEHRITAESRLGPSADFAPEPR